MISLTRTNGTSVVVDPALIAWIDLADDTIVSLVGGDRLIVLESLDDIVDRITANRCTTAPHDDTPRPWEYDLIAAMI